MKKCFMVIIGLIYKISIKYTKFILGLTIIFQYFGIIDNWLAISLYTISILGIYEILIYLKMNEIADDRSANQFEAISIFNKYFKYTIANMISKIFKEEEIKILCKESFLNNRKEDKIC